MNKPFAEPIRFVMVRMKCAYCDAGDTGHVGSTGLFGIMHCDDHADLASRDFKAWAHRERKVLLEDYEMNPLFVEGKLLERDIAVVRTSGAVDMTGWQIVEPSFDEPAYISYSLEDKCWHIGVWNAIMGIWRSLLISNLKLSLPETQHGLVDAFLDRINSGIYTAEHDAYCAAVERWAHESAEAENHYPGGSDVPPPSHKIVVAHHPEYGYGRVVVPVEKAVLEVTGDPAGQ